MSMKVDVADDDGNALDAAGLSQLAYDPAGAAGAGRNMTEKTVAQDATLRVDGIDVSSRTNVVADALEGVTLTLAKANPGAPATLELAAGTKDGLAAMEAFVKAYNDVQKTIAGLTKYDAANNKASVLTGDATVRAIQQQLRALVGGAVPGLGSAPGTLATLAEAGAKTAADGTLALDTAKFTALLKSNATGVERLFAALGTASDPLVTFAGAGAKTTVGDYPVAVTQLATRATLVGSAPANLTIVAGVNDTLSAVVDGIAVTVTLGAGTYASASALAAEVAGRLNGAAAVRNGNAGVAVTANGGVLTLTSSRYGSASQVTLSGTAAAALVGAAPVATAGLDVAGTIGGVAAIGSGQTLAGATGSPAEGLKLTIAGGATGARGSVSYTEGLAAQLDRLIARLTGSDGVVAAKTEGVQASIKLLDRRKAALEDRLERVEAAYLRQYQALDSTLATLSAQSAYLAQQLATLPKIQQD
jgi:flagellar hook-associated protein 2